MYDQVEDEKQPTGWDAAGREDLLLCVLPGLAVALIVGHFTDMGQGRAAGLCALVDILVVKLRWTFKGRIGFWFAISLILLGQTALIARVPFGNQWMSAYALLPIALVVYLVDECIVSLREDLPPALPFEELEALCAGLWSRSAPCDLQPTQIKS